METFDAATAATPFLVLFQKKNRQYLNRFEKRFSWSRVEIYCFVQNTHTHTQNQIKH